MYKTFEPRRPIDVFPNDSEYLVCDPHFAWLFVVVVCHNPRVAHLRRKGSDALRLPKRGRPCRRRRGWGLVAKRCHLGHLGRFLGRVVHLGHLDCHLVHLGHHLVVHQWRQGRIGPRVQGRSSLSWCWFPSWGRKPSPSVVEKERD